MKCQQSLALKDKEGIEDYDLSQVYSFVGRAYRLLGIELQRKNENSNTINIESIAESRKSFNEGIDSYFKALAENREGDPYVIAKELVRTVITSGDLNNAIKIINELDRKIKQNKESDAVLIRIKADIYFFMDRENDAALTYEEWIKRGSTSKYFESGSSYKQRMEYLKEKTGHPINFIF